MTAIPSSQLGLHVAYSTGESRSFQEGYTGAVFLVRSLSKMFFLCKFFFGGGIELDGGLQSLIQARETHFRYDFRSGLCEVTICIYLGLFCTAFAMKVTFFVMVKRILPPLAKRSHDFFRARGRRASNPNPIHKFDFGHVNGYMRSLVFRGPTKMSTYHHTLLSYYARIQ